MSLRFFSELLKSPRSVGSVCPSSSALAQVIVQVAGVVSADFVLEIGAGSGAITGTILNRLRPGAQFLAIEKSPILAQTVADKFPSARVVNGCATQLTSLLDGHGSPDSIVSALPWTVFDPCLQDAILKQVTATLHSDGIFATFAYFGSHWLKGGRSFQKKLEMHFRRIERTPIVLANIPPAFVYFCSK